MPSSLTQAPPDEPATGYGRAILLMCAAVALFACCDTAAKWATAQGDPLMSVWARYASNMVAVAIVLNPVRRPDILRSNRLGLQILRSALLLGCTGLNFVALRYLQLTETTSIQFGMPLLVVLLAGPLLGEWAGPRRVAAVLVGFVGIMVVTRPFGASPHPAMLASVASTIFYALYAIVTRMLAAHDRAVTTVLYTGVAGMVVTTPILPFVWVTPPTVGVWLALASLGLFAAVGHWLLVLAHARAPAPVLSPFIYTQIVWMGLFGLLVFGDVPDRWTLIGAAIVIASGLYLLWWERRAPRPARRPGSA